MTRSSVPKEVRARVADHARHRCGYCLTQEAVVGMPLDIEHIIPLAAGGDSEEDNLWLACPRCNQHKADRRYAPDPLTGSPVELFDPRRQRWEDHFVWDQGGLTITGLTPTGRPTVTALRLNNAFAVRSRRVWIAWGWHPPK
jgi:hypothetical protein